MIYSNNAECGEIFSLQSLFSTVQVEFFRSETFIFYVALRVGKESMECKELPNYFTPRPGKVFIGCPADGKKFLKKFRE